MTDWLDKKLETARDHAEGYGQKRALKETADDVLKAEYSKLMSRAPKGTGADRDAWVRTQPEYDKAIEDKRNKWADWVTAELYMKIIFTEADKYRTDQATNRNMDRAHR